jgi:alkanesulfonate monooxygenase SsuD/methylene tetrahydromethanopterin reductase-like flavin-dependent oxidoreductase (luciferase family)
MLDLTGRLGDGWACPLNTYVSPEQVPPMQARIDEAARRAGRAPTAIRRIYNVMGGIDAEPGRPGGLSGSADLWAETLAYWATGLGFDTFIFYPSIMSAEQVERFAREVVPRTRELVAQARGTAG